MHRRSPLSFLIIPLFITLIEGAAFYGWNHMLKEEGHMHLLQFFNLFYAIEVTFIAIMLLLVMGSFSKLFNVKRTYYSSQGIGIVMADMLPKLLFTVFVILFCLIQGGYVLLNKFLIHGTRLRLNLDFILVIGSILSFTLFIIVLRGIMVGRFDFKVIEESIHFDALPKEFNKLKVVQVSDIHIGSFFKHKDQIAKAVEIVNSLKPDIIVFTGDMVNHIADETNGFESIFQKLQAPLGKFAILGNHDYGDYVKWESKEEKQKNLEALCDFIRKAGFDLLLNENRIITKNGQQIAIIGVENWGTPPFAQYGYLPDAVKGTEDIPFKLLLSHDPSHWDEEIVDKTNINLTLSGHTHGMQFGIRIGDWQWSPVQWRYEKWHGLYTHHKQNLYVNRGLGHIGFPGRVGMLPEITLLELCCASAKTGGVNMLSI